jgi:hypothetical protein
MDEASEIQNILEIALRQQQVVGGFLSATTDHPHKKKLNGEPQRVVTYHKLPGRNPKIEELLQILEEIQGPVIMWARFAPEIEAIVNAIGQIYGPDQVAQYWGAVDEDTRERERLLFQNGAKRFFVGNQQTGGMGIDLSAAQTVIYYSNTFSVIDREQSEERPYGPKITHPVLYIDLVCEDSIDEHIKTSVREKRDFSEYVKQALKENRASGLLG